MQAGADVCRSLWAGPSWQLRQACSEVLRPKAAGAAWQAVQLAARSWCGRDKGPALNTPPEPAMLDPTQASPITDKASDKIRRQRGIG